MTGLAALVRLELMKLSTTRTGYGLLGVTAALTTFDAVLRAARAGNRAGRIPPLDTPDGLRAVCTLTGFALVMAVVFGVTIASGEFRHGTATQTYLTCPNRSKVLLAKALAAALGGLVFGAVGSVIATSTGLAFATARGDRIALSDGTLIGYGVGSMVSAAVLAAAGVALGSVVRSQVTGVVAALIWAFFFESILGGLVNPISPYLPFTAATTVAGARLGGGGFGFAGSNSATALPTAAALGLDLAIVITLALTAASTRVRADIS